MERVAGENFSKIRFSINKLINSPVSRVLTAAAITVVGCRSSGEERPLDVTYDVKASVSYVFDKANPNHNSGELIFPNIPQYEIGEPQKSIRVLQSDFFDVLCSADQMLILPNKNRLSLSGNWSGETQKGKDFTRVSIHKDEESGAVTSTDDLKVDKRQLDDTVKEIVIKVGGRVVYQSNVYGQEGVSLSGIREIVRASEFRAGIHQAICEFRTKDGNTFRSSAEIEILENRPY